MKKSFSINIPNIITLVRILLVPIFVIFLLKEKFFYALMVFAIAGISDGLDGLFARYFNQKTITGAYLDPIADKLLIVSSFVSLAILKMIPSWLTVIVLTRDLVILLGILIFSIMNLDVSIKPTMTSKFTTVFQLLTVIAALLALEIDKLFAFMPFFIWNATIFTVVSGLQYIFIGLKILQNAPDNAVR